MLLVISPEELIEPYKESWKLGHKGKGFLDILVCNNEEEAFLMIECKTWGDEYDKEKNNTLRDGGQLFSYFIQEKTAQYLCIYTSTINEQQIIEFKRDIVVITDKIRSGQNQKEVFELWSPQIFEKKGIFEKNEYLYNINFLGIIKSELRPLTEKNGSEIFNRFAEILRKNVVSDKTNAFNKIFNLFLCKIVDEDKREDNEEMKFQWKNNENNEVVLMRLNDLYKDGMKEYLTLEISAVSENEFENSLKNIKTEDGRKIVRDLFIQQKLYSGNEFAFKEVFDKTSFDSNAIIVKEIVKLLEEYQIKYSQKQQFLGDFFERLLNTGIKQEAGQFFTPIPIASFICKSLPIKQIINRKNNNKELDILPYCIDYASGSGHFLTEIMSEIDVYVKEISDNQDWINGGREAKKRFNAKKDNFYWAKEYIYGIEKDYRLAKTTKINTFLNGDGDANIICGDGLDNFKLSKDYTGILKKSNDGINNEQFDILVANPPYSVSGFKTTLPHGRESFKLFEDFTDQSSEIECLFIERMSQLLRVNGVAGVILPSGILYGKNYSNARKVLFKFFAIKGIVEIGDNAFMETSKNTVILFLEKIKLNLFEEVNNIVKSFLIELKDVAFGGVDNIFSKFVSVLYPTYTLREYSACLFDYSKNIFNNFTLFEEYTDYYKDLDKNKICEKIIENEKEKMICFLMVYNKQIPIAKSGSGIQEKDFLGYKFSKAKGREGIEIYRNQFNNNELTTKLFNENKLYDPDKLNYYIQKSFLDDLINIEVNTSLKDNVIIEKLHNIIDFNSPDFLRKIITTTSLKIECIFEKDKLYKSYHHVDSGGTAPQDRQYFINGKYPFIRAGNIGNKDRNNFVIPDEGSLLNDLAIKNCSNLKLFKAGTILFAKSGQSARTNNIARLKEDAYVVNHLACIFTDDSLTLDFLYYYLEYYETSNLVPSNSDYPSINLTDIKNLLIPIINISNKDSFTDIVNELKLIDEKDNKNKLKEKQKYMAKYFKKIP